MKLFLIVKSFLYLKSYSIKKKLFTILFYNLKEFSRTVVKKDGKKVKENLCWAFLPEKDRFVFNSTILNLENINLKNICRAF